MKAGSRSFKTFVMFILSLSLLYLPVLPHRPVAYSLSREDERILGEKFVSQVRERFEVVDDPFAVEYINDLGNYLVTFIGSRPFPFHFYIIKDNTLNAFAGPGGHIFFFTGLINILDQMDELASVISHEIGHISGEHLAHRIEQNKKIGIATMAGILAGVLIGGEAARALSTGAVAAGMQAQLHYSREDERQADMLGFRYMGDAGLDPSCMLSVLKKIQQQQWLSVDNVPPYLLTHPATPERMSHIDTMLAGYVQKTNGEKAAGLKRLYPFFKTVLEARYLEPDEAESRFKAELDKAPDSTLALLGLGMVSKERSEYLKSIDYFKKALVGQPESVLVLRNLGEAYQFVGKDLEAIGVLERALKTDSQDRSTLFLLAVSHENLEQYQKAVDLLERLASLKGAKEEVFYHLGVCYGRQDKLALAHYNFGIHFEMMRQAAKAEFHFRKAEDLSRGDPTLTRRIHKAREDLHRKPGPPD